MRRALVLVLVLALVATVLGDRPAVGQTADQVREARRRLEQVREERAAAASRLDAARADERAVTAALDALDDSVRLQEGRYATATRKAADAAAEAVAAQRAEQAKRSELDRLSTDVRRLALQAYVRPPDDLSEAFPAGGDLGEGVVRRTLSGLQFRQLADVVDELDAAREDLAYALGQAEAAAERAARRKAEAADHLATLETALERQRNLSAAAEDRLDRALSEAAYLADVDRQAAADLEAKQQALAERLAAARALAERAAAGRSPVGGGGTPGSPGGPVDASGIVNVGGIRVHRSIASQVAGLLEAARADGHVLGGGGYRSPAGQIAVRRANCGPSQYDIWQKPPSQCRPPAARPGKSMHERGLAIDVTCSGVLITSRSNGCFQWLAANASRFGLFNLPSEPWHWSTNGN